MMEGWGNVELGSICSIKGGKRLPKGHELLESETSHKYIRARDIKNGKINFDQPVYINEKTFDVISRYIVNEGDVIITIVGANIGDTAMVTKKFDGANLTENAVKLMANKTKVYSLFLKYALVPDYMKYYFQTVASGAAQDKLGIYKIKKVKINLPPLKTQRKIASILSGYDDLIENNLKRIKLLEEQAQQTYEEWFVRFKFPGYEDVEIDEESGLPVGWEKVKLDEIAKIQYGKAFKASQFNSEGLGKPIIRIRNIPSSNTKDFTTEKVDNKYIVKQGDLLIGMDGEFYVNNWSGPEGYLVQRVCSLRSKNEDFKGLLTEAIRQPIKIFQASIDGATVAHLGKKHLDQITIAIPKNVDVKIFTHLLNQKINLSNQNHLLKEARDILLPRLMSGIIDIDGLEVDEQLGMVAEEKAKYNKV